MSTQQLQQVFESFASFGDRLQNGASMDNARFAKLARDCKLIDSILTPTQVDIIFSKVKPKGARRIGFREFLNALDVLAGVKYGNDPDGVQTIRNAIVYAGGPLLDNVHLPRTDGVFDKLTDSALFTGSHKERFDEGGAGLGASGRKGDAADHVDDLSQITRPEFRGGTHLSSASAARRTGSAPMGGGSGGGLTSPARSAAASAGPSSVRSYGGASYGASSADRGRRPAGSATSAMSDASGGGKAAPTPRVVIESEELQAIFSAYCAFGATSKLLDELDNARFAKLARESGLCDGVNVNAAAVDLAFSKAKGKGKRTMSYDDFQQALAVLAPQRYPEQDIVGALQSTVELIIIAGGPAFKTAALPQTTGVFDKLTDPRYFTASHKEKVEDRVGMRGSGSASVAGPAGGAAGPMSPSAAAY